MRRSGIVGRRARASLAGRLTERLSARLATRLAARLAGRVAACLADRRGSSAVEFALVSPVLLLLLCGIVAFGIYLGAANSLRQLAAEAARASVAGVTDDERATLARQRVATSLSGGSFFAPGSVDVAVGPDPTDPLLYTVTLSFNAATLGLGGLSRVVPVPPDAMRSRVSVRRGGL